MRKSTRLNPQGTWDTGARHRGVSTLGALALSCVPIVALLIGQAHQRFTERQAWLDLPEQAGLDAWVEAQDRLHLSLTLHRLWSSLPPPVRPAHFDMIAAPAERARTAASTPRLWRHALRLWSAQWFRPALGKDVRTWVKARLFMAAAEATWVSQRTLGQHIALRNQLAQVCNRPGALPDDLKPACTDLLAQPLMGPWLDAFQHSSLASGWRPYLASPEEARLGKLTYSHARLCSLVPYATNLAVVSRPQPGQLESMGWQALAPGECVEVTRASVDAEADLSFVAEAAAPDIVAFVARHANVRSARAVAWRGQDGRACLHEGYTRWREGQRTCPGHARSIGLVRMPGETVYLTHPGAGLALSGAGSQPVATESALRERVRQLADSLNRQVAFEHQWTGRALPYALGPRMEDHNGVFETGVTLRDVPAEDIYNDPNQLADGDILLALNGHPIYSPMDLALTVISHASSYAGGAEVPMRAVVLRDGRQLDLPTGFYFNPAVWGQAHALAAFGFGAADPLLFSRTPDAICRAPQLLHAVASGLSSLASGLCKAAGGTACEPAALPPGPTEAEISRCVWRWQQRRALARQTSGTAFSTGAWVGVIAMPTPLRLGIGPPIHRLARRSLGRGRWAAAVANAAIEIPETWVQERFATAPTADAATRTAHANHASVVASAIGFLVGGVLSR